MIARLSPVRRLTLGAIAALAWPAAAVAADPTLKLSATVDYSTGKYGLPQATDAVIVPLSAGVTWGDWSATAVVPFATIKGPSDVVILADEGGEAVDTSGELGEPSFSPTQVRSGLSDVSFSLTHSFNQISGTPLYLDTTARVRLPTGDRHKGLGVGATDFFLLGEVGGDWKQGGLYADLGRRFLGDLPDLKRVDGWQVSVGGWWNAADKVQLGATYDWRAASLRDLPAYQLLGGYASYRLDRNFKLTLFTGAGFGDSSPGLDVSLTLSWRPTERRR